MTSMIGPFTAYAANASLDEDETWKVRDCEGHVICSLLVEGCWDQAKLVAEALAAMLNAAPGQSATETLKAMAATTEAALVAALLPEPEWREDGTAQVGPFWLCVSKQRYSDRWGWTIVDIPGRDFERKGFGAANEDAKSAAYAAAQSLAAEILALAAQIRLPDALAMAREENARLRDALDRVPPLIDDLWRLFKFLPDGCYSYPRELDSKMTAVEQEVRAALAGADAPEPAGGDHNRASILQVLVGNWGCETFPDATNSSIVQHLKEEVKEIDRAICGIGEVPEECADAYLMLLHLAHRGRFDLHAEACKKFDAVKNAEWEFDTGRGYSKRKKPLPPAPREAASRECEVEA